MAPTLILIFFVALVLTTVGMLIYTIFSILWILLRALFSILWKLLRALFWPVRVTMRAGRTRHPVIEPNRCRNKLCSAVCPSHASFCPRCGRPVLRVVEPKVYVMPARGCKHVNVRVTTRAAC